MATRPAGLRAFINTFTSSTLDLDALRAFQQPVYFTLGGRTNPSYYARMAERTRATFPNFTLEVFDERHHFDPPHRIEPERTALPLRAHWARADGCAPRHGRRTERSGFLGRAAEEPDDPLGVLSSPPCGSAWPSCSRTSR
jgi:hypothetical protein